MSMQDPIADLLTRIRNAQSAKKTEVSMPSSIKKLSILKVLKEEGYVFDYKVHSLDNSNKKEVTVYLLYYEDRPVISKIKRVSKPGLRVYRTINDLPKVLGGLGIAIISTSSGVVSDRKARELKCGGEVLCTVE